jgi:hypothetical protein
MSPRPSFRQIAPPLDADDASLARLADQMGVPTLVKAGTEMPPATPETRRDKPRRATSAPSPPEPPVSREQGARARRTGLERLTVDLPGYLIDAIKRDALDRRATARHVLMLALQSAGFRIDPTDLVRDARRSAPKPASS